MHTRVEFKSSAFPKYPDEDLETVNPGRWGKRLAEHVRDNLPRYGIQTKHIRCEDWGWLVHLENPAFPIWIGCGPMEEIVETEDGSDLRSCDSDGGVTEFALFITAQPGFFQRLFKRVDTRPAIKKTSNALKAMIEASPHFMDVSWSE